jgi:hypothetical protein
MRPLRPATTTTQHHHGAWDNGAHLHCVNVTRARVASITSSMAHSRYHHPPRNSFSRLRTNRQETE